jgi:hypothetical protein
LDEIEAVKLSGESTAGFVTSARSEIARRQTEGNEKLYCYLPLMRWRVLKKSA